MLRTSLGLRTENEKGFTLTELMVVVGIIATMVLIASISMTDYLRRSRLQEATRNVDGDFMILRNTARVQQQDNIVVLMNATGYRAFNDGDRDLVSDPTDTPLLDRNFTGGVQLAVTSTTPGAVAPFNVVEYTALGTLRNEWNREITVSLPSLPMRQFRITIHSTGVSRVDRSDDGGASFPTRAW